MKPSLFISFGIVLALVAGCATKTLDSRNGSPESQKIVPAAGVPSPGTYLGSLRTQLDKKWPANRMVNIVCHGHSVPAGYFKTPVVDTFNAYPHLWHQRIKETHPFAVVNVFVTAIGGEQSEQGATRFERDVLARRPDLVTLDYGLNDRRLGLNRARKAWSSMIEKAQAAGVKVILLTPTGDTSAKLDDPNDPLNQHAEQIRSLAVKHGVGLVDSLATFKQHIKNGGKLSDLMSQVNHPNRTGHNLVANLLLQWVN